MTCEAKYSPAARKQTDNRRNTQRGIHAKPILEPFIRLGVVGGSPPLDPDGCEKH